MFTVRTLGCSLSLICDHWSWLSVIDVPLLDHRLASTAMRALQVDAELSPLVRRSFSLVAGNVANGNIVAEDGSDPHETILRTEYRATTNRMLRVAVNGFMESLGVVLQVMEELDVDVLQPDSSWPLPKWLLPILNFGSRHYRHVKTSRWTYIWPMPPHPCTGVMAASLMPEQDPWMVFGGSGMLVSANVDLQKFLATINSFVDFETTSTGAKDKVWIWHVEACLYTLGRWPTHLQDVARRAESCTSVRDHPKMIR
jgi:EKC/KEOPS complex subunit PCC1/LAGE3